MSSKSFSCVISFVRWLVIVLIVFWIHSSCCSCLCPTSFNILSTLFCSLLYISIKSSRCLLHSPTFLSSSSFILYWFWSFILLFVSWVAFSELINFSIFVSNFFYFFCPIYQSFFWKLDYTIEITCGCLPVNEEIIWRSIFINIWYEFRGRIKVFLAKLYAFLMFLLVCCNCQTYWFLKWNLKEGKISYSFRRFDC